MECEGRKGNNETERVRVWEKELGNNGWNKKEAIYHNCRKSGFIVFPIIIPYITIYALYRNQAFFSYNIFLVLYFPSFNSTYSLGSTEKVNVLKPVLDENSDKLDLFVWCIIFNQFDGFLNGINHHYGDKIDEWDGGYPCTQGDVGDWRRWRPSISDIGVDEI